MVFVPTLDRRESCSSPGPAATAAERSARRLPAASPKSPDIGGFGRGSQNKIGEEMPISPAFEAPVVSYRTAVLRHLRMPVDLFNEIVDKVTPLIQTQKSNWRDPLPPALKVDITLHHLATGEIPRFSSPINADLASPIN